ncbi:hypothetical protein FLP10_16340 [Agromyces intestinalis]|uniref:DUF5343 domain-containing protein n=1 Tax=Agromyces intestinalis TaxID=2592652 RepID=A0A5C1YHZ0_9MICO|nr:DUF5343 domain-containing protein [Agromyces intestinalis]QEO15814.1 hypothetical protein FLP10_16340 [Agromyces intestinalis]
MIMVAQAFPYTITPVPFSSFLKKLQDIGVPEKIDRTYLSQIGYASANHRVFIPIMKFVGLLDSQGKPTDRYRKGLRGGTAGRALVADGIREGYASLFATYPDANARSTAELTTFMKAHSDLGDKALKSAVATFETLCKFGDFPAPTSTWDEGSSEVESGDRDIQTPRRSDTGAPQSGGGSVTINVNIALSVDATSDPAVYDAFFAAMAKHLRVLDGSTADRT